MEEDRGILKFLRGIDLSRYRSDDLIASKLQKLENLRWIKLSCQNLQTIPDLSQLMSLEYLSLSNNLIDSIDLTTNIESINTLNLRHNRISACAHREYTETLETTTLDLSHNQLTTAPDYISHMPLLVMLNLSFNKIKIFDDVFSHLPHLLFLDVSHNQLTNISLEKCFNLHNLNISYNPLNSTILTSINKLTKLRSLNLAGLQLSDTSVGSLNQLANITELDISCNFLLTIPDSIVRMKHLVRLNVSNNMISEIPDEISNLIHLKFLNISFNSIKNLPFSIGELRSMTRLFANANLINVEGIPSSISCLGNLEVLMLAFNHLETIPVFVCRCHALKKLVLRNNRLLTLPESIYELKQLKILDTKGNKNYVAPKKPVVTPDAFSSMNFSYENVRNMVFKLIAQHLPPSDVLKEDLTKHKIIVHKQTDIKKLAEIKKSVAINAAKMNRLSQSDDAPPEHLVESKKISSGSLRFQPIHYNDMFDENIRKVQGVSIFLIDNFSPSLLDENFGNFYDGDCYIILNNFITDDSITKHTIFFWIGNKTSIDKRACAAMHAVNLRNFLGSNDSTHREEQADESQEFKNLFPFGILVNNGMSVPSSLYNTSIKKPYTSNLYRIFTSINNASLSVTRVPLSSYSLDPRFVFMLVAKTKLYLWYGDKCKPTLRNKASLYAQKFNKLDRKNECQIVHVHESPENLDEFMKQLGVACDLIIENKSFDEIHLSRPIIYKLHVGSGYIELPQAELTGNRITRDILKTDSVYIIDCWDDVFVWSGKKTTRIIKEAARRLASQLEKFFIRPVSESIQIVKEGQESMIFKSHFYGWDDICEGAVKGKSILDKNLNTKNKFLTHEDFNLPKMDIANIFMPRQSHLTDDYCQSMLDAVDEYLDKMDCFIFYNKSFIKLPEPERGQFYSNECYVFLCKTIIPVHDPNAVSTSSEGDEEVECKMEIKYRVFFWEGRHCSRTGFLTFSFSLKKQFEQCFGEKLSIERIHQQQEPYEFLALFHPSFVINRGYRPSERNLTKYPDINSRPRLYQIRNMMGIITLRCVEIDLDARLLCSRLLYILTVPEVGENGVVYLWVGSMTDEVDRNPADIISQSFKLYKSYELVVINEGEEPEEFWVGIGGKLAYDTSAAFLDSSRLFRCSNESGFYGMKEKYLDFCQNDLNDEDVMMLDTGTKVFLWEGSNASFVEITLTQKLVLIYVEHLKVIHSGATRKIIKIKPGQEPIEFRRVFQGFEQISETPSLY